MTRDPLPHRLARRCLLLVGTPLVVGLLLWSALALPRALHEIEAEDRHAALLARLRLELSLSTAREAAARAALRVAPDPAEAEVRAALDQALDEAPALNDAMLVDAAGIVRVAEHRPDEPAGRAATEGSDVSHRPFWSALRGPSTAVCASPFLSSPAGPAMAVVCEAPAGRRVVAVLSPERMAQQLQPADAAGDVAVAVVDGLGRLILPPRPAPAGWREGLGRAPLVQHALDPDAGDGSPGDRGEQRTAERVADGVAEARLQRLDREP